jgi:hypothetical protein
MKRQQRPERSGHQQDDNHKLGVLAQAVALPVWIISIVFMSPV